MAEELYATLKTNHGDIELRLFPHRVGGAPPNGGRVEG